MIRVFVDNKQVFATNDKGWLKKNLKVDIVSHKDPNKNLEEHDIPLPVLQGYDIVLRFGRRPQTDLGVIEEINREKLMDEEAVRSLERERIKAMDITDPHHPDYIAPGNYTQDTKDIIKEAVQAESDMPVTDKEQEPGVDEPGFHPNADDVEEGKEDEVQGGTSATDIQNTEGNDTLETTGTESSDSDLHGGPNPNEDNTDPVEGGSDTVNETQANDSDNPPTPVVEGGEPKPDFTIS